MTDSQRVEKKRRPAQGRRVSPRKSPHVPGQALGYFLQPTRLLQMLLDAPADSVVSLEVFEDIGLEMRNGEKIASQSKSAVVKNPLTDKSPELWKSLANWCDAVDRHELDPEKTLFEIYLAKPRKGKIASLFDEAKTPDQVEAALAVARQSLFPNSSHKTGKRSLTQAEAEAKRVLSHPLVATIIQRFRITRPTRDPLADLRTAVSEKWVRPESVDMIIQHAHGWIKERVDGLLLEKKPAFIGANDFLREMLSFLPRCDFRNMIVSLAGLPSPEEIAAERVRTYVRQLEIISVDDETTLQSINEYLRASVTRTKLAEQGIVHNDSFTEFTEALTAFWRNKKRQNSLVHTGRTPEDLGQLLLSDCCLRQQTLQGLDTPAYFTPGSYHALADDETIGWHPEYQVRLKSLTK